MNERGDVAGALRDGDDLDGGGCHYTSLEALVAIVQTKSLRASNIRFLNDQTEFLHLKEEVLSLLRERRVHAEEQDMIQRVIEQIEAQTKQSIYVASLSAKGDLLSQWRAYCPSGLGVSIGFNSQSLNGQFVENAEGGPPFFLSSQFQKIRYYSSVHRSGLSAMLETLLRIEHEDRDVLSYGELNIRAVAACMWPAPFQSSSEQRSAIEGVTKLTTDAIKKVEGEPGFPKAPRFGAIGAWVTQLSAFIKHDAFEEECEWRKVVSKDNRKMPGLRFRTGRSALIPFVHVMLDVMNVEGQCVPRENYFIDEVVIGPTPTPDLTFEALTSLFSSVGHPEVKIRTSRIPFRNW